MLNRLIAWFIAPVFVISLRLTGYNYLKAFTTEKYRSTYLQSLGRNHLWGQVEGTFIIVMFSVFSFIPERLLSLIKKCLSSIIYYFMPSYRRVIETNLEIAFKDRYSLRERKWLTQRSLLHSLDSIIWLLEIASLTREKVLERVQIKGYHYLETALIKGKGVILVAPHYSRFLFPAFYAGLGNHRHINFIIRRIDNALIGEVAYLILNHLSLKVIIRNHWALKKGLYALKRGEILFLLMDQNVAVGGIFVPFFGVPASTFKGVNYLRKKTNAVVICCHAGYRNGIYELEYSPEISGESLNDEESLLKKIHDYFEEVISQDPERHLWMHPRWKKRPPGEPTLYPRVKNLSKL